MRKASQNVKSETHDYFTSPAYQLLATEWNSL